MALLVTSAVIVLVLVVFDVTALRFGHDSTEGRGGLEHGGWRRR